MPSTVPNAMANRCDFLEDSINTTGRLPMSEAPSSPPISDRVNDSVPNLINETSSEINDDENEEERLELEERERKPWYRRPSSWWVIGLALPSTVIASMTFAPRIDVYTTLACEAIRMKHNEIVEPSTTRWRWRTLPPPPRSCAQDPDVQAAVAGLSTLIAVAQGLLTCLTAGWWGQLSDRYGRITILKYTALGFLTADFNFLLVSLAADKLPGGHRFLVFGAFLSGCMGGMSSIGTAITAYMSDTTAPDKRSRNFSMGMGLIMCGMALGPALGSYTIRITQNLLSVFYLGVANHALFIVMLALFVPESVTKAAMKRARKRHAALHEAEMSQLSPARSTKQGIIRLQVFIKVLFTPMSALKIFVPHKEASRAGRDWSMSLLAATSVLNATVFGIYTFKFQYMQTAFGWDSKTTGLWLTVVSTARALYLVIFLPVIIHFFKPKIAPIQLPLSDDGSVTDPYGHLQIPRGDRPSGWHTAIGTANFDYRLALGSLFIEFIAYVYTSLAVSPLHWTIATMLTSFGSGYGPGMRSVALILYEQGPYEGVEIGRLFGAFGVADSAASHVISPSLFGFVYMTTVDRFPRAIFIVATGLCFCATTAMLCVRIPGRHAVVHGRGISPIES